MVNFKSTTRILFVVIWTIVTFIECYWFDIAQNTQQNMALVSWLVVCNLILQALTLKWCRLSLVSFFFAFIFFYYVFHFGQVFITGLFPHYKLDYLNYVEVYMTDNTTLDKTIRLCIVSINAFFIGGLLAKDGVVNEKTNCNRSSFSIVIKKTFLLLLPFRLFVDGVQLYAASVLGYYGAIKATNMIPGVIASIGNMWYALVPLYYLTLNTQTKKKCYLIVILLYMVVTMLTGNRGHQIVCLASLMIVMLSTLRKIEFVTIAKYGLMVWVGMLFVDIVYSMRETSISDFFANPTAFMDSTGNSNILLETIGTFGETIYTPYLTIMGNGCEYHTWFGEAFVKSVIGVIPDVFGWFKEINNAAIFPKNLGTKSAIGGSFCGEMFYNFKGVYPLMSAFFGCVYCYLSNIACASIKTRKYENAIMAIIICSLALWWVRDAIGNLTRQIVWMYWILLFFQRKYKRI